MFKALTVAAVLMLAPATAALAQDAAPAAAAPSEEAIEAAAEAFEARMETFGARAEAIAGDEALDDDQKEARIASLWAEYQPDIMAFTASVSQQAAAIAAEAMADIDLAELTGVAADALSATSGMVNNGAWASNDPEHMQTYGLMAEYALGQAKDAVADEHDAADAIAEAARAPHAD